MASYHCSVKVGGKGKAAFHAAYISREGKYSDSPRYEDLECSGYGNIPKWAEHNPAHFWQAADEYERANGATYREIEVALPRELTPEQRRDLVENFVQSELGERHAYQWAIHTPKAALEGGEQPHAHIMYSERTNDEIERDPSQYFKRYNAKNPERGGCKKDSAGTEERLLATRQSWAEIQNAHLARYGHAARVDHRSLKAQGIDREPEFHLGGIGVRKLAAPDISALLTRRAAEGELERANHAMSLIAVSGNLASAKAARDKKMAEQQAEHQKQAARDFASQSRNLFKQHLDEKTAAEQRAIVEQAKRDAIALAELQRQRDAADKQRVLDEKKQAIRTEAIRRIDDLPDLLQRQRLDSHTQAYRVSSELSYARVALLALKNVNGDVQRVNWQGVEEQAVLHALTAKRPRDEIVKTIAGCSPLRVSEASHKSLGAWVDELAGRIIPPRKPDPEPEQDNSPRFSGR